LAARFQRYHSIPDIPNCVIQEGNQEDPEETVEFWIKKCHPVLDRFTALALFDQKDSDLVWHPMPFAIGADFAAQSGTDDQLQAYVVAICGETMVPKTRLTRQNRAGILAELVASMIHYLGQCVGLYELEHAAGLIQKLPLEELQKYAGIIQTTTVTNDDGNDNKAALVVALVEQIFDDVLVPADSS